MSVGKAETLGKGDRNLSANIRGIEEDPKRRSNYGKRTAITRDGYNR